MIKFYQFFLLGALLLGSSACQKEDKDVDLDIELEASIEAASDGQGLAYFRMPSSDDYNNIPQDPNNRITTEKVTLGKMLFHETGIAIHAEKEGGMKTYSCASCHFADAGFQASRVQGIGDGGLGFGHNGEGRIRSMLYTEEALDVQPIRSPAALNTAYQELMLWNGQFGASGDNIGTETKWAEGTPIAKNHLGFQGIETQAIAGLEVHRLGLDMDFIRSSAYKEMFDWAFPEQEESERYTLVNAGLAIAAYERTLLANESPFQLWLKGQHTAMSEAEKRGALVFFSKAECASCHAGPSLASMRFEAYGMNDLYSCGEEIFGASLESSANLGRGGFTGRETDNYAFKVPQLYNLKDSPFYGHGSSFRSIKDVVQYKNAGVAENRNVPAERLSAAFKPLSLSEQEVEDLTNFIENALYDPNLKRYEPRNLPSGLCFPFNDPMAKNDLGCD